jgi:putative ATPase
MSHKPLAEQLRPTQLNEVIGQMHLLGPDKILRKMIETDTLTSVIFWGPAGTGKTTLARVIATTTQSHFEFFSAVLSGVKEIRQLISAAETRLHENQRKTVVFCDEIHRFNKSQQDAFLPYVENGTITLIGATTENPSFSVNSALLSRSRVFQLHALTTNELVQLLQRAAEALHRQVDNAVLEQLAIMADGDGRSAVNTLEVVCALTQADPTINDVCEAFQSKAISYDKNGENHYAVISAFIKSIRGSDPNAAVYWLARMLEAGEDPVFIARRLAILASEDIGLADSSALSLAVATQQAVHLIGMPEARINLSHCAVYLALAPKSNSVYAAINEAIDEVKKSGAQPVPLNIVNAPTQLMKNLGYGQGYAYDHESELGTTAQTFLPEALQSAQFYRSRQLGKEPELAEARNQRYTAAKQKQLSTPTDTLVTEIARAEKKTESQQPTASRTRSRL